MAEREGCAAVGGDVGGGMVEGVEAVRSEEELQYSGLCHVIAPHFGMCGEVGRLGQMWILRMHILIEFSCCLDDGEVVSG